MHQYLLAILLLLTAAVATVWIAGRFRVPAILAYLAVGIGLGPHGARVLTGGDEIDTIAEFGVVFLMFSIGLEFRRVLFRSAWANGNPVPGSRG